MKRLVLGVVVAAATIAALTQTTFGATTVRVTARDFSYSLSKRTVSAGTVTFRLTNRGDQRHDFKIAGRKTAVIRSGGTATLRVRLRAGRRYRYICTVPGHEDAGMKGTLRVR
jgi:plastocyanin